MTTQLNDEDRPLGPPIPERIPADRSEKSLLVGVGLMVVAAAIAIWPHASAAQQHTPAPTSVHQTSTNN